MKNKYLAKKKTNKKSLHFFPLRVKTRPYHFLMSRVQTSGGCFIYILLQSFQVQHWSISKMLTLTPLIIIIRHLWQSSIAICRIKFYKIFLMWLEHWLTLRILLCSKTTTTTKFLILIRINYGRLEVKPNLKYRDKKSQIKKSMIVIVQCYQ
jgi:hypothetical protein